MPARILIADDNSVARTTIRALLDWHSFQVCGEAKNGKEAIEKVMELKPAIILLDINMPELNGVKAAYEIRRVSPATKIVFLTIHNTPGTKQIAINRGGDVRTLSGCDDELLGTRWCDVSGSVYTGE